MHKPIISVIMSVYNTEKWVGLAIESILNQSFENFEFIIIDDYSTDKSYKICKKYAKSDNRIKLYRNKKNMGIAFTKNKLIRLASTDYLASQDSDDISCLDRLQIEYKFLKDNLDYSVVSGNNIIINERGKILGYRIYSNNIANIILKESPVSHPTTMIRKSACLNVGGYSNIKYVEDYDLWIKLYKNGYKIKNLEDNLLFYRLRKGSQKKHIKETIKGTLKCQKNAYSYIKPSFSDLLYHFSLYFLLILPKNIILRIFSIMKYKSLK